MKSWTLDEACARLPWVEQHLDKAQDAFQDLQEAHGQVQDLETAYGGPPSVTEAAHAEWRIWAGKQRAAAQRLEAQLDVFAAEGIMVKDLAVGLVDFRARLGDRDVWLCWRRGEATISHYHDMAAGFAGRREIPQAQAL